MKMSFARFGTLSGLLFATALLTAQTVYAQSCGELSPIAADRPGTLGGPLIVPIGTQQFESGWAMVHMRGHSEHALGTTMLRVPVHCRAEVRVTFGGYAFDRSLPGNVGRGLLDGHAAVKVKLVQGHNMVPHLAVLAGTTVPLGGPYSHRRAEPEGDVSMMWNLPRGHTVTAYGGYSRRAADTKREWERNTGANWTIPLTSIIATYVDYCEVVMADERSRGLTGGLQLFPHDALQLDVFVGAPVRNVTHEVSIGAGIARRF